MNKKCKKQAKKVEIINKVLVLDEKGRESIKQFMLNAISDYITNDSTMQNI